MKWFRSYIKQGSRLALFALAIQFALSFGHCHCVAAQAAPTVLSDEAIQQQSPSRNDTDQQPNDACPICAVITLANTALFATPPLLLLPQAVDFRYLTTDAEFVRLNAIRVAFQPRAPPVPDIDCLMTPSDRRVTSGRFLRD